MKKLVFIWLLFFSLVPVVLLGQSRPSWVDNSPVFPPAETQWHSNCSSFSLIYYLKSSLWNQYSHRDPKLSKNQFSADFVWNQVISSSSASQGGHFAGNDDAVRLMSSQGSAAVDNFLLQTDVENLPDLSARESGLAYRTKKMNVIWLYGQDSVGIAKTLNQLKDSLSRGACFTIHIPVFSSLIGLNKDNPFYHCSPGISQDSMHGSHYVAVVGYDDAKKAFKAINSNGLSFGDNGYFYMDYDWFFFAKWWGWTFSFLEEDFNYKPELTLNLDIENMVSGEDIFARKNIFVDTVFSASGYRFDYVGNDYFGYNHLIKIKKVNNQIVPTSLTNDGFNNINNIILLPGHNHDGHRQVLSDLTDYVKANDFKSLELVMVDPISAAYTDASNNIVYSYNRTPSALIKDSYIKVLGTNKRIVGKVIDLPDTTIVSNNFYSYPAAFHLSPPSGDPLLIKKCVSTLKRKMITFRIEDIGIYNAKPVFTQAPAPNDTLKAAVGSLIQFQFQGFDPQGEAVFFSLAQSEAGASIDSNTGLFKFQSNQPLKKQLAVVLTDGYNNVISQFNVAIFTTVGVEETNNGVPTVYSLNQNYPNPFNPSTVISFSIPKSGFVSLKVYNLLGQEVASLINGELSPGVYNTKFDASSLASGIYIYQLRAKDFNQSKKLMLMK